MKRNTHHVSEKKGRREKKKDPISFSSHELAHILCSSVNKFFIFYISFMAYCGNYMQGRKKREKEEKLMSFYRKKGRKRKGKKRKVKKEEKMTLFAISSGYG